MHQPLQAECLRKDHVEAHFWEELGLGFQGVEKQQQPEMLNGDPSLPPLTSLTNRANSKSNRRGINFINGVGVRKACPVQKSCISLHFLKGEVWAKPLKGSIILYSLMQYLEQNEHLILAILEGQNQGKFTEIAQCQAKLQHNLTYLAELADALNQPQIHSQLSSQFVVQQGQGTPHLHVAMSQQQPDLSTLNMPFHMNDQQQKQLQQHK